MNDSQKIAILTKALDRIRRWDMPRTGEYHDNGEEKSYSWCYGANGERDHVRSIAGEALDAVGKEDGFAIPIVPDPNRDGWYQVGGEYRISLGPSNLEGEVVYLHSEDDEGSVEEGPVCRVCKKATQKGMCVNGACTMVGVLEGSVIMEVQGTVRFLPSRC